ncbi:MAG: patatin family protein, partial [Rhodocyclales bacterium]|nr:patatin family protein [Rhodocyclales bacterium]
MAIVRLNHLFKQLVFGALIASALAACTTLDRKNAVPQELTTESYIEGMPGVRYKIWSRSGIQAMIDDIRRGHDKPMALMDPNNASYLALSGGGDNGAFGAGLLTGWSERGDRPEFRLVTGVSTGAMIAPFAFLGSDYDYVLKRTF